MATKPNTAAVYDDEALAIRPRNVQFDWTDVPLHYLPGEPFATQFWNVMHLVVPVGEQLMAGCLADALPYITDERLREEAIGFIGQETMHAASHGGYHEHLAAHGIDIEPVARNVSQMLRTVFGGHGLTGRAEQEWLAERLAFYAGMEHFTAVVGQWLLDASALDEARMHPMMLDLLRWHGAEEVEHRSVLFDVFQHVDGGYGRRARTAVIGSMGLLATWLIVADYLIRHDPSHRWWKPWPLRMLRSARRGLIPNPFFFLTEIPPYLKPGFHPSGMGSPDKAIAYLATAPAAHAAGGEAQR
ncbi:MAG TPA: metal-dependent hydrolase [Pseudonocardia sp.]|jgi:predicted metal-dependent hydrolase|nr:metal-dependent hydrolase [Pseudonocardia sp.]